MRPTLGVLVTWFQIYRSLKQNPFFSVQGPEATLVLFVKPPPPPVSLDKQCQLRICLCGHQETFLRGSLFIPTSNALERKINSKGNNVRHGCYLGRYDSFVASTYFSWMNWDMRTMNNEQGRWTCATFGDSNRKLNAWRSGGILGSKWTFFPKFDKGLECLSGKFHRRL